MPPVPLLVVSLRVIGAGRMLPIVRAGLRLTPDAGASALLLPSEQETLTLKNEPVHQSTASTGTGSASARHFSLLLAYKRVKEGTNLQHSGGRESYSEQDYWATCRYSEVEGGYTGRHVRGAAAHFRPRGCAHLRTGLWG